MNKVIWAIAISAVVFMVGWSFGRSSVQHGNPYTTTDWVKDTKAARELYDSAVFYKADRDEQMQRRMVAEQQNAQLKQQLQQYQAAVEKINERLKKAKDITPPATNTNAPTVSTNQAAKEAK